MLQQFSSILHDLYLQCAAEYQVSPDADHPAKTQLSFGTHASRRVEARAAVHQGRVYTLPDVWIRPPFGGKGRKMTGQLEAHANGFRYSSPKGETLDIMYRCARAHILTLAQIRLLAGVLLLLLRSFAHRALRRPAGALHASATGLHNC